MIIAGLITVKTLPIAQYPSISPPSVTVNASYPGADALTVAETVGVPIEEQINGIEDMMYMSSTSGSDGSYSLTVTFEQGTDLDMAAVKVQNRVSLVDAELPDPVRREGVSVFSQSSNIVLFVALTSDDPERYDALYLTNYANLNITDELARIDGVGGANAFGAGEYSMRVWLDPDKMRAYNITSSDISAAIESQNMAVSGGSVGTQPMAGGAAFTYTVTARGRLQSPDEFGNIVLRTSAADGSMLRLRDVATIDLGSQQYSQVARVSDKQCALIAIQQLPGANALSVAEKVEARLDQLQQYFPEGVKCEIVMNSTEFVTASIDDVLVTFVETTLIVMIVIMIFLQNWRATIIPMLTIPVSLIATFAVMKLMGFSINTLTLFGMVLAIAIVVDDAIVVVEDCSRILDKGKCTPREAALQAMKELSGPVVGEVLVLLSVFIPTAFISGITGELYKQFALTIAVSTAFSGFNALTFTPALCALFLRPKKQSRFFLYVWFNEFFGRVLKGYDGLTGRLLRKPLLALLIFAAILGVGFYGFEKWPESYVPEEDMGYFLTSVELPEGASLARTDSVMRNLSAKIESLPEVDHVLSVSGQSFVGGGSSANMGSLFVVLRPWDERKGKDRSVDAVIERCNEIGAHEQEAVVFSINPPSIPGLGTTSGEQMQILDINNLGAVQMSKTVEAFREAAAKDSRLASVTSLYEGEVPQYRLTVDRDKIKLAGLEISDVFSTLGSYTGSTYVNDFVEFGRVYQVIVAGDGSARDYAEDLLRLSVRAPGGEMVPFASFATVEPVMGQPTISRYNMYQTASVTGTPAKGVSSGDAIRAMEDILKDVAGNNYSYAWTGEAYQETQAGTTITTVLIFALLITFLVLAAQYESWSDSLAVIITAPAAILGAILGCIIMGQSVSIYTQIGIILLLGMAAKNAILIVEYARSFADSGMPPVQAAQQAGNIRFRPIMMTALAFVFGVMPMLFATGAGAASRISLGAAVVFGMAMNAAVGTLFVPPLWKLLQPRKTQTTAKPTPTTTSTPSTPSESSESSESSDSPASPNPQRP